MTEEHDVSGYFRIAERKKCESVGWKLEGGEMLPGHHGQRGMDSMICGGFAIFQNLEVDSSCKFKRRLCPVSLKC